MSTDIGQAAFAQSIQNIQNNAVEGMIQNRVRGNADFKSGYRSGYEQCMSEMRAALNKMQRELDELMPA